MEYRDNYIGNLEPKTFILQYNIIKNSIDKIKLINLRSAEITCINYGPYDNGYLLIGLSTGVLLVMDHHQMEILLQE